MTDDKLREEVDAQALKGISQLIQTCLWDVQIPDSMLKTPERVLKAFKEQTSGYAVDVAELFKTSEGDLTFEETYDEMIVLNDIEFTSLCEHHLLPFIGTATVGYIPRNGVVGVSKLGRLVDCFARRFQIQERMTREIADALVTHLNPIGVGVIIEAQHQCIRCRGVRKRGANMITSALRGVMKSDASVRAEFLRFSNG